MTPNGPSPEEASTRDPSVNKPGNAGTGIAELATVGATTHAWTTDDVLLRYLAVHDAACPLCGYDVHALTEPVCPECGEGLRLSIRTTRLRLAWWLVGMIAWALGIGCFLMVLLLIAATRGSPPSPMWSLWVGIAVTPLGAGAWLVFMRRIRRCRAAVRAGLAIASVAAVFSLLAVFFGQEVL